MQPDLNTDKVDKTNKKLDVIIKYIKLLSIIVISVAFIWQASAYKTVFFEKVEKKVDRDSLNAYREQVKEKFDDADDNQRTIAKQLIKMSKKLGVEIDEDLFELTQKKNKKDSK